MDASQFSSAGGGILCAETRGNTLNFLSLCIYHLFNPGEDMDLQFQPKILTGIQQMDFWQKRTSYIDSWIARM